MNYSIVKKELKSNFDKFLKPLGYKSKVDSQGCQFEIIDKEQLFFIGYGVRNYIDEFKTGCYIGITIVKIAKIQQFILEENSTSGLRGTLGSGMADYFNVVNYNYHIKTQHDIELWMQIVKRFYNEYAVPFFEKYNSVSAIDKLLNDDPSKRVKYSDDLAWRIIKGLIAARLNNNPRYHEIKAYYSNEVEAKLPGHFMYAKCRKVIEFLENHTREELVKLSTQA
ncbi:MAG: hypothetical protein JW798_04015 [Prolixibacteraceae bacterium]|nr:hypothetical protein [Prolixibacteraceae bacterium]